LKIRFKRNIHEFKDIALNDELIEKTKYF